MISKRIPALILALALSGLTALPVQAVSTTLRWSYDTASQTQTGVFEYLLRLNPGRSFNLFSRGDTSNDSGFSLTLERYDPSGSLTDSLTWHARYCSKIAAGGRVVAGEFYSCPALETRGLFYNTTFPMLMTIRGRTRLYEEGNAYPTLGQFDNAGGGTYRLLGTPDDPLSDGSIFVNMAVTPLPASAWLLGTGLGAGLWLARRRRRGA